MKKLKEIIEEFNSDSGSWVAWDLHRSQTEINNETIIVLKSLQKQINEINDGKKK